MKKFCLILLVLITFVLIPTEIIADASDDSNNPIDIYLIAGQSNAVGNTDADVEALKKVDERFESGFNDILYYGYTDVEVGGSAPSDLTLVSTKLGLGLRSTSHVYMGPEVGMAHYLSQNKEGQKFGIIKYASGSSSIYDDIESKNNSRKGNWYSPGVASALGVEPKDAKISGNCYRVFLDVVRSGLEAYRKQGYTPRIKGLAWIQGESESGSENYSGKYSILLQALINDMRKDLSDITKEDLSELHVVVSKIPASYQQIAQYTDIVRTHQDTVAANDAFVTTVDNDFLLPGALNRTDDHHYYYTDMLKLGQNLMKEFLGSNLSKYNNVKIKCSEGGISNLSSKSAKVDEIVSTTLTPAFGYELTNESIVFKSKEGNILTNVVYSLKGNFLQIKMPDYSFTVEVKFYKIPQFDVKINASNGVIYRTNSLRNPFRGENLSLTFVPDKGYKLSYLAINGESIDLTKLDSTNEYLTYSITVSEDLEIYAIYDKLNDNTLENNNEHEIKTPDKGCVGSIYLSLTGMSILALGVIILRKKSSSEVK